ncbi:hypothetical protein G6F46_011440 [Rhizopus delemar]|uniref:Cyclin N-terminal domain-containing protein n=2 Tax=Rhizopus TaxID=4842 RepID=A0A9P6Z0P1_9FUNG|nr:hypothetical protein G6F43_011313 [Rhizopus delemar]KAG1541832.1 hypothetical protein G6F51_007652 [Rhizopus arrhizus]KAG1447530.1 hypothetical protein G6F55_011065 [Rhizopus delemar]KAG1500850.1 hypothetical protein G6F54_003441 [Rhizopus delemar]KAG1507408.1 hypothetical protein G6F53_008973 [Rhizopus delemar]
MVALIYLDRLKSSLPRKSQGEFDTPYKLFIVAVVLASKFIEDSDGVTQSIHSFISPLYSARELNDMERSFLGKEYIIPLTLFDFLKLTLTSFSILLHIAIVKYKLYVNLFEVDQFVKDHKDFLNFAFD